MSTYIIDSIIESFPNLSIPIIEGESICETIKRTKKLLIENTSSIQSTLGRGNHSFLSHLNTSKVSYSYRSRFSISF